MCLSVSVLSTAVFLYARNRASFVFILELWLGGLLLLADFAPILRFPIRKLLFGPQDGAQNGPRSAQDGSKTLLKSAFIALENRLGF